MDPGASGPNGETGVSSSRLRRRAPAIAGSADRAHLGAIRGGSVGQSAADCRRRVVPRKVRPFVPGTRGRFDSAAWAPGLGPGSGPPTKSGTNPGSRIFGGARRTMSITDPLSLTEAKCLAGSADTGLLRATRDADLETPIGAFLRLDDGGPAYLLESVEGGERLGRYSFLGTGPRRLLEVRGYRATIQHRPLSVDRFDSDLPIETLESPDPLTTLRAFLPRRRLLPVEGMPRFTGGAVGALAYDAVTLFEPSVP